MIRAASTTNDGRPLVLLGLTPQNLQRLQEGEPILVDAAELGLDGRICITFGPSERRIAEALRALGIDLPGGWEDAVREAEQEHRRRGTQP